jgi:hypothetical protein
MNLRTNKIIKIINICAFSLVPSTAGNVSSCGAGLRISEWISNTHRQTEGLKNYFFHVNYTLSVLVPHKVKPHFIPMSWSNAPLNRIQVRGYCTVQDAIFPLNCYVPRGQILSIWRHHLVLWHQTVGLVSALQLRNWSFHILWCLCLLRR